MIVEIRRFSKDGKLSALFWEEKDNIFLKSSFDKPKEVYANKKDYFDFKDKILNYAVLNGLNELGTISIDSEQIDKYFKSVVLINKNKYK